MLALMTMLIVIAYISFLYKTFAITFNIFHIYIVEVAHVLTSVLRH